ncbi:hypothetical protein BZG36_00900 [Bifiguratus adelaidae]|uniref:Aspartate aminotransferase n=1 Tax=Bifiguratus adelaidae TaxID=1938954 RepID=A0A261Y5H0_9FUNG|nr:hypothetical protein BZG36_00900 [Bifiguratus adelaidae]
MPESQERLAQLSTHLTSMTTQTESVFQSTPRAPPDVIFNLTASYKADTFKDKINLGVGAYRDNDGKPFVLPVVKKADAILHQDPALDHEYLPIGGIPTFTAASARLILGADSSAIKEKRVVGAQTISGTGANHLGALFLSRFYHPGAKILLSNPTWANHKAIFNNVGIETIDYPYWDAKKRGLDLEGMLNVIKSAPEKSIVLLHACAHNPTGVDPTQEQWKQIAEVIKQKNHFTFFDCAYQGFASGNLDKDAWAVRYFESQGLEFFVCQSYAKNFGLYGERAGCLTAVTSTPDAANRVFSQFEKLQRSEISNPPAYGARVVNLVLNDPTLSKQWQDDLTEMSGRIIAMRKALYSALKKLGTPGTWEHIVTQIGMFSFTGLTKEQVSVLKSKYHVYLTDNGRISMAGLNTSNVEYFAKAVDDVVRNV